MAPRGRQSLRATKNAIVASSPVATAVPSTRTNTSRGRPRKSEPITMKQEIPDSDEPEALSFGTSFDKPVFQGVLIPARSPQEARSSRSTSTALSKPDSLVDSLDIGDTDTPDTSAFMTSVEDEDEKPTLKSGRVSLARVSSELKSRKRSRAAVSKQEDSELSDLSDIDTKLAAKLQAEEYEMLDQEFELSAGEGPATKKRKRSAKEIYSDSEEDYEDLYESVKYERNSLDSRKIQKKRLNRKTSELEYPDSDADLPLAVTRKVPYRPSDLSAKRTRLAVKAEGPELALPDVSEDEDEAEETEFDDSLSTALTASDIDEAEESAEDGPLPNQIPRGRQSGRDRFLMNIEQRKKKRAGLERTKLEKQHPEILSMWKDLEAQPPIKPVAAQQPSHINRKLKPFQLEGLDWLRKQEQTKYKGGLLGDEMGMGKTIQACSLIMSDFPAKQPTLVVVPPVALMQWQTEITDYTSGQLKVLVYHISANPKCKNMTKKELCKYNVVMISYSGLESIYRKESKGWTRGDGIVKEDSVIHAINFHRIILDEAHSIKSRTTGVAKACFALQSTYKWCLSGTPVQNRIGEFFSLLRFLNVRPFACYFCKQCSCAELHWEQDESKRCKSCKHSGFNHVSVFNQEILNPITGGESEEIRQAGFKKLRLITDRIMLRRLKRDHTSSMELPPKEVIIHNEFFSAVEHDFSTSIMSNSVRKFDTYVAQGVMLNNYANIFGLIMQMRQVADHPDLILRRNAEGGQNILVCCICDEPAEEAIRSRCRHEFCRQCAKTYIRTFDSAGGDADCPKCHIPLAIDWDQPDIEQDEENVKKNSIINRIKMDSWTSSTKIEMLVYDLYKLRSKKQTHKSIVFSQFTSMLQLVQWRLQKSGFSTVLLDGSMTPAQRQKSIDHFMTNVECEVFLVSLKAGGVALNLTEASQVFIIDPWWNPAAEWQSADRCHRIGQRRPCKITRLCIEDSVESRIVLLQEKKANLINGTINNDQVAMEKLTPEDMQFLFRGS